MELFLSHLLRPAYLNVRSSPIDKQHSAKACRQPKFINQNEIRRINKSGIRQECSFGNITYVFAPKTNVPSEGIRIDSTTIPATLRGTPTLSMSLISMCPVAKPTTFEGVEVGSQKANSVAIPPGTMRRSGCTCIVLAM